jgi:hypothetical protein
MQEIHRGHPQTPGQRSQRRAWGWAALIFGVLAVALVLTLKSSVVWAVVFLLLGVALIVWGTLMQRPAISPEMPSPSPESQTGYWQDWLAGWYWQTDASNQLTILKPDRTDSLSWQAARHWVALRRPLWACWSDEEVLRSDEHRAALTMIEMRMKSRLPLDVKALPWPFTDGLAQQGPTGSELRGVPRLDAQGQFVGYHGVWCPLVASVPAPAPVAAKGGQAPGSEDPQVLDKLTEQEALRYALSHDLRAPLRVVDGFARILKEDYAKSLDRIGNDHLDRVLAAATRMNGMIDAILVQAQLSQTPLQYDKVDLSALAREVAQEQVAARRADGVSSEALAGVEVVVAEGLVARADEALVRRVLDNLIGNALKYSGKVSKPCIEVGMVAATDPEVYFVRDNGAGFDMQHADKLFGLFQRLHSTKEFPGTGVGLAGVQNIIRRHGGRVWAEAAPGQGACFYFTLKPSLAAATLGMSSVHRPEA